MNLKEDIKIGSVPYFESWYIEIETETEQEAIEKKQQIIQWQKKAEKYDILVKKIKLVIKRMKSLQKASEEKYKDYPYMDIREIIKELSSLTEEKK